MTATSAESESASCFLSASRIRSALSSASVGEARRSAFSAKAAASIAVVESPCVIACLVVNM